MSRSLLRAAFLASLLSSSSAFADGPAPGEEAVFEVSFLNLPTGTARIRVGRPEGDIWPVIFQARTSGVAKLLDIREHLVSYWNTARMASLGSDLEACEVGDLHADRARFERDGRSVTVVEQRTGRAAKEEVLQVPEGTLDLAGAFFWLRFQPLAVGSRYELPVLSGTTQFLLIAEVLGEEEVKTPAGTFPCRKIGCRPPFTASSPPGATPSCGSPWTRAMRWCGRPRTSRWGASWPSS